MHAGDRSASSWTGDGARRISLSACALVFVCAVTDVQAVAIHRQVDAAGRVTYSDRPDLAPSHVTASTPALGVAAALAGSMAMSSRHAAVVDANEAARRLRQAELERKRGEDRLPGERADAGATNDRYWRRQEALRHVVEQARRRTSETARLLRAYP